MVAGLEGKEQQEGHHETEQAHGLRQGKSQDGIGEKLLLQRWVAGVANDQTAEHTSNTSPRPGHPNGSSTSTNELGRRVNVPLHSTGLEASHSLAQRGGAQTQEGQSRHSDGRNQGLAL